MTFVVRLLALVLAALWLPLTMHCKLAGEPPCCEAANCFGAHCDCGDGGDCHLDVCKIIESGNYFLKKALLSVPAASLAVADILESAAYRRSVVPAVMLTEATGAPPGWNRIWQFAWRAAPAPRAPSALGC